MRRPTLLLTAILALVGILPSITRQSDAKANEQPLVKVVYCTKSVAANKVVTGDCLKRKFVDRNVRSKDALYDTWIAIGRRAVKPLTAGKQVLFDQVFPESILTTANKMHILQLQGHPSLHAEEMEQDRQIPVVRSLKDISTGSVTLPANLRVEQIRESRCPSDAVGDIWIASGRVTSQPIKAGEIVYYHQVIPSVQWTQWLEGKF